MRTTHYPCSCELYGAIMAQVLARETGQLVELEHTGGGLVYLRTEVGEGGWTWFCWSEGHGDYGTVHDSFSEATVVNGCVYSSSGEMFAPVPDQPILPPELSMTKAMLAFLASIPEVVAAYPEGWQSI